MKKLITIVAVVALAAVAQASSFSWKLSTGSTYAGMNVYALTGTTSQTVLGALAGSDAAAWVSTFEGFTAIKAGTGSRGVAAGTTTGIAANDKIVYVILDGAIAEGTNYYVVQDYSIPAANVFDPPSSGTIKTVAVTLAGQGTLEAIPEPTSGLLMLLGMAGLALRRRRA